MDAEDSPIYFTVTWDTPTGRVALCVPQPDLAAILRTLASNKIRWWEVKKLIPTEAWRT